MSNPTFALYRTQADHANILALLEESEGELTPEIESAFSEVGANMEAVADDVGKMLRTLKANEAVYKAEMDWLKEKAARAAKAQETLRTALKKAMQATGIEKIKTPLFTLYLQDTESVEVSSVEMLPAHLKKHVPESFAADKTAIKKAIKAGEVVPGATLQPNTSLQIR